MIFELLHNIDQILVLFIHNDSDNRILDSVLPLLREPLFHLPLYLVGLLLLFKLLRYKAWIVIVGVLAVFALSDISSGLILKPLFQRLRPCHDPAISIYLRPLVEKGGLYSFPSSHASSHMGIALYFFLVIQKIWKVRWNWLFIWAMAVGYAQIYVGKHYPSDVLAGFLLGSICALIVYEILKKNAYFRGILSENNSDEDPSKNKFGFSIRL